MGGPGGSSPRMWGTRAIREVLVRGVRFIPTHVGNTVHHEKRDPGVPVHPHACGEHFAKGGDPDLAVGSSPRMWGTLSVPSRTFLVDRFIPTHVGNTLVLA